MGSAIVKQLMEVLPFRDAVLLHHELLALKPLSKETQEKIKDALRKVKITHLS